MVIGESDDELMLRLTTGGTAAEQALATLYDRYSASAYALALRIVGDSALAEHVLQDAFVRVWRNARQYTPGRVRLATWLLHLTRNVAISEQRAAARRPEPAWRITRMFSAADASANDFAPEEHADDVDVAEQVWREEQGRIVRGGLARLPVEQRQAIELAYFAGQSHREIAAAQGAPVSTVKTRLALGLRKLSDHLALHGVVASGARAA